MEKSEVIKIETALLGSPHYQLTNAHPCGFPLLRWVQDGSFCGRFRGSRPACALSLKEGEWLERIISNSLFCLLPLRKFTNVFGERWSLVAVIFRPVAAVSTPCAVLGRAGMDINTSQYKHGFCFAYCFNRVGFVDENADGGGPFLSDFE